jgi:hypothetical protein
MDPRYPPDRRVLKLMNMGSRGNGVKRKIHPFQKKHLTLFADERTLIFEKLDIRYLRFETP